MSKTLQNKKRNRRQQGFTLIEAMIVVVIMGIVGAMAGTSMYNSVEANRIRAARLDLAEELTRAQTEAIVRNRPLRVRLDGSYPNQLLVTEIWIDKDNSRTVNAVDEYNSLYTSDFGFVSSGAGSGVSPYEVFLDPCTSLSGIASVDGFMFYGDGSVTGMDLSPCRYAGGDPFGEEVLAFRFHRPGEADPLAKVVVTQRGKIEVYDYVGTP